MADDKDRRALLNVTAETASIVSCRLDLVIDLYFGLFVIH